MTYMHNNNRTYTYQYQQNELSISSKHFMLNVVNKTLSRIFHHNDDFINGIIIFKIT